MERIISLDTEATGLDLHHGAAPYIVTTCNPTGLQRWWPWDVDPLTRTVNHDVNELEDIQRLIDESDTIVLHNAKFDAQMLAVVGVHLPLDRVVDTIMASHLLASNHPNNLTARAIHHLGVNILPYEDRVRDITKACRQSVKRNEWARWGVDTRAWRLAEEGEVDMPSVNGGSKRDEEKPWKGDMWLMDAVAQALLNNGVDLDEAGFPERWLEVTREYANVDSAVTLQMWFTMEPELKRLDLWEIFLERMKLVREAFELEWNGVTASKRQTYKLIDEYTEQVDLAQAECLAVADQYDFELVLPNGAAPNDCLREFFWGSVRSECPRCGLQVRHKEWTNGPTVEPVICKRCAKRKRKPVQVECVVERNPCLNLPIIIDEKTGSPSLNKNAIEHYVATLEPGLPLHFVQNLFGMRSQQTAITYMRAYERFWLPILHGEELEIAEHVGAPEADWCRLHPSVNPVGTDHLRWASYNPNCVDAETEFLTTEGWVRADRLREDHVVAQYWKNSTQIEFVKPSRVIAQHYDGMMYHITTEQQIDLMVTANHRCLVKNRKTGKFSDKTPDKFGNDYMHFNAGFYHGGDKTYTADEVTWLCAVQADGHYCETAGREYGIRFIFKKQRKADRLRECMVKLGVKFSEDHKESGLIGFYIGTNEPAVMFAKSLMPDKCFDKWIIDCDRDTLDMFLEELFNWDGDYTREKIWSSSDKKSADWVQTMWVLSGSRAYMRTEMPDNGWAVREHNYINITSGRDYSLTSNFERKEIPWNDMVYCVTVPSEYVVVRRNGRVSVTGNSQNISKKQTFNLRRCFGPAPGREWWSMDAKNVELRIPAYEAQETDLIWIFEHPDQAPYYGSYHLVVFDTLHPELFAKHGKACKDLFESTWYQWVKNGNFAIIYGAQRKKADQTYHVPGAYDKVRDRFPRIAALNERYKRDAERFGYVETIPDKFINPRRGYPILVSRSDDGRTLPTTPFNYHISGTAMQWTNRAMVKTGEQLRAWSNESWRGFITLQVHDELVFDVPRGVGDKPWLTNLPRMREIQRLMESCGEGIGVPTPVSIEWHGESYAVGMAL